MGDQAAFSTIKGEEIPFTWAKILNDIPIPNMHEKKNYHFFIEPMKYQAALIDSESFASTSAITTSVKTF